MIYAIPSDEIYQPTVFRRGQTFSRLVSFLTPDPRESRALLPRDAAHVAGLSELHREIFKPLASRTEKNEARGGGDLRSREINTPHAWFVHRIAGQGILIVLKCVKVMTNCDNAYVFRIFSSGIERETFRRSIKIAEGTFHRGKRSASIYVSLGFQDFENVTWSIAKATASEMRSSSVITTWGTDGKRKDRRITHTRLRSISCTL